jgi:undecaprenyl-diphosphatase
MVVALKLNGMELKIVKYFNQLGKGKIDSVTDFLSRVKYLFTFWFAVTLLALFFGKGNRAEIVMALAVVTIAHFLLTEGIIKHSLTKIWGIRRRPYLVDNNIIPVGRQFSDSSFPSSHMATTLAMLVTLTYFFPIAWPVSLIFVLLMAFARLHNGMHYPSDILAGTALGIGYGVLGVYVSKLF